MCLSSESETHACLHLLIPLLKLGKTPKFKESSELESLFLSQMSSKKKEFIEVKILFHSLSLWIDWTPVQVANFLHWWMSEDSFLEKCDQMGISLQQHFEQPQLIPRDSAELQVSS